jgi:hypothetical protein
MNQEVAEAIEELKRAFAPSELTVTDDGSGGAYVIVETVDLGPGFTPTSTWMGGHITGLYPASDIYPVFIAAEVCRANGRPFEVPVTPGHQFAGRPALQVSRRNNQIHLAQQTAVAKFNKILDFLGTLP